MMISMASCRNAFIFLLLYLSCHFVACEGRAGRLGVVSLVSPVDATIAMPQAAVTDSQLYRQRWLQLVHGKPSSRWPADTTYPLYGAVLPYRRVIAFYGNYYAPAMGILGQLPLTDLQRKMNSVVKDWELADPTIPVQPALHYVAVTAQRTPGQGGKYRLRMPASQLDRLLRMADSMNALVYLDVQVGLSTYQEELPALAPYLRLPQVHLGIDPEYSMKSGRVPCSEIGAVDASDINFCSQFLADLVRKEHLPPKMLVVHRFTNAMVSNYKKIRTCPEVQIVMNMDGFGFPQKKIDSYTDWIAGQPVQFTGFKLFFKQDVTQRWPSIMSPQQVLQLYPQPIYIQYQ
ncbi:hypothetical protein [Paraflavitalea pollutisoli]|uniref:hypothetical protein n=1 Tax=Paraflavitalea pollutisoli TaxID=3034143 RepID=UPI0023EB5132|nr:hypothetical protein [Paraflavitalea sp. H1-2-19X]